MKKINHILEITFSIGAALVILGAYGKIIHASWGGFMLSVGMITEVLLFLASGFERLLWIVKLFHVFNELLDILIFNKTYSAAAPSSSSQSASQSSLF